MREAVYINEGLFALKKCIRGLNKQDDYIPYQVRNMFMHCNWDFGPALRLGERTPIGFPVSC
jgi:hypothetical protein